MNLRKAVYREMFLALVGGMFVGLGLLAVGYGLTYRDMQGWSDAVPRIYVEGVVAVIVGAVIAALAFSLAKRLSNASQ